MATGRHRTLGAWLVAGGVVLAQGALLATLTSTSSATPGNNGTIKIENVDVDSVDDADSANHPHVGNPFAISWYGFDAGTRTTSVSFAAQEPSGKDAVAVLSGRTSFTFTGSGVGGTLDHTEQYLLDTTGLDEHEIQGFHIKVTVTTDVSHGNDTKSKVFWIKEVQPTESPSPTETPTVTPSETPSETPTVEPSVLPTELTKSPSISPSISPSVKGVKIVKRLPRTGPAAAGAMALTGAALVLTGVVLLTAGRRGAHAH